MDEKTDPSPDRHIERLLERFAVDPSDTPRFRTLEEHFYLGGQWSRLAGVYECRISALEPGSEEWAEIHVRLGRVLEERLEASDLARRHYQALVRRLPRHAEGLSRLRALLARAGDLTGALQLAEVEEGLDLPALAKARTLADIGRLWFELGEREEARIRFTRAAELDPASAEALAGLARLAEQEGRKDDAITLLERRVEGASGLARVEAMEALAAALPASAGERVRTLLREIVREDPTRPDPIRRLIELESASEEWSRVDELMLALWKLTLDREARLRIAIEAATLRLDEAADAEGALAWTERAERVSDDDDPRVLELRARAFRRRGDDDALVETLGKLDRSDGGSSLRTLEVASLHLRANRPEQAAELLREVVERDAENDEALELYDACLARLGRGEQRAEALRRRIARSRSAKEFADLSYELGRVLEGSSSELEGAEEAYRAALLRVPEHGAAAGALRELLRKQNRESDLVALLTEMAERAPSQAARASAWNELGELALGELDDPGAALDAFTRALESAPGSAPALAGLRAISERTGDLAARIAACEHELGQEPPPERARALYQEMIEGTREAGDLFAARRIAARWAEHEPTEQAYRARVELERAAGDVAGERNALENLDALLHADPEKRAAVLARLGQLVLEEADPDALESAAHWFRASLELRDTAEVRRDLIDVYRRSGRLPELARELEIELRAATHGRSTPDSQPPDAPLDEREMELRLELARASVELGHSARAIEALEPAFAADPARVEVADLLEGLLAEEDRVPALSELLGQRLQGERDPTRRREIAHRRAALLLDGLERARDALELLGEFADPSRDGALEGLHARALEIAGSPEEQERWLAKRESHVDGPERRDLLLRIAALQQGDGRLVEAISTLRRAETLVPDAELELIRRPLLSLVDAAGSVAEKCELLERLRDTADDPGARAAFALERARLLLEDGEHLPDALAELARVEEQGELRSAELHLLADLYDRAGARERRIDVLERLVRQETLPRARGPVLLELAELLQQPETRDDARAAESLTELAALEPGHPRAFAMLLELYRRTDQLPALEALIAERLERDDLGRAERAALAHQLAHLQVELGDVARARRTLEAAHGRGASTPALHQLQYRVLELERDLPARLALCEERALHEAGAERAPWLRRWLRLLEDAGESHRVRLEVIDRLLRLQPDASDLLEQRLALVRESAGAAALADAVESLLGAPGGPAAERRRLLVREFVRVCERQLDAPARALARVEAELDAMPELLPDAARLAGAAGDAARRADYLLRWLDARPDELGAEQVRQLGLALVASGRRVEACTPLWRALDFHPHDREVLEALETALAAEGSPVPEPLDRLRLIGARFALESVQQKPLLAARAFAICEEIGDPRQALHWLQRWHATASMEPAALRRWLELERGHGTPAGALAAIAALAERGADAAERGAFLAEEAALRLRRGELDQARDRYARAVEVCDPPEPSWLEGLAKVLGALGRPAEQAEVLERLTRHAALPAEDRARYQDARIALLVSHPDLRERAAQELRMLVLMGAGGDAAAYRRRARALLDLYAGLGRDAEWCELAEQLRADLEGPEQLALDRELAARLCGPLAARRRGVEVWQRILEARPDDVDALEALSSALRAPGDEAALAEVLERRGRGAGPQVGELLCEAADLRWRALGDAVGAFDAVEQALSRRADAGEALCPSTELALHQLRTEVAAHLGRRADEAASLRFLLESEADSSFAAERWLRLAQLSLDHEPSWLEAQRAAERALELASDPRAIRSQVREVFERVGHFEHAARLLREEIEEIDAAQPPADPGRLDALLRRHARISWEELGSAEDTCASYQRLERLGPLGIADRERFADSLEAAGRPCDAIEQRRLALEAQGELAAADSWLDLARAAIAESQPEVGLAALGRALELEPDRADALELRAGLHHERADFESEVEDLARLGETRSGPAAAETLAVAANVAVEALEDRERAAKLFLRALAHDPGYGPALLGAGRIAFERDEWAHAERYLGRALALLEAEGEGKEIATVSELAADAAAKLGQDAEAFRYLELALENDPRNPGVLDRTARLAAQMGLHQRARECLERRLASGDVSGEARAEREERLARACQELGDLDAAARALESVVAERTTDEVARAGLIDLLEKLGAHDRALAQLDAWMQHAPESERARLSLRAARLESAGGRNAEARARLVALVEAGSSDPAVRLELAESCLRDQDPDAALAALGGRQPSPSESGSAPGESDSTAREPADLAWARARAELARNQLGPAARSALHTLEQSPSHMEAARLLGRHLGHAGDWRAAIAALETALDAGVPDPNLEAELWEGIGRAYAGPLENIEGAERAYRRALATNPMHERAREALADVTAFDPATHEESARLHRELLKAFPARPGSWRALATMAETRRRDDARATAEAVLCAIGAGLGEPPAGRIAVRDDDAAPGPLRAATDLLHALDEADALPRVMPVEFASLPPAIQTHVDGLVGRAWSFPDYMLRALWTRSAEDRAVPVEELSRRTRKRVRRSSDELVELGPVDIEAWRAEVLARATATALTLGEIDLAGALGALFDAWPTTRELSPEAARDRTEALQLCAPARALLLRIADATVRELGL